MSDWKPPAERPRDPTNTETPPMVWGPSEVGALIAALMILATICLLVLHWAGVL